MFGQAGSAVNHPVVKTGCVIVRHGSRVIAIIFVYQPNPLNLIFILVQFIKDFHHILCHCFIADQFSCLFFSVKIVIQKTHIQKIFVRNRTAAFRIRNTGNSLFDCIGQRFIVESRLISDAFRMTGHFFRLRYCILICSICGIICRDDGAFRSR